MTDPAATPPAGPLVDARPVATVPVFEFKVLGGQQVPAGHRLIQAYGAFEITQFLVTIDVAEQLGRMLSAPSVSVPTNW